MFALTLSASQIHEGKRSHSAAIVHRQAAYLVANNQGEAVLVSLDRFLGTTRWSLGQTVIHCGA